MLYVSYSNSLINTYLEEIIKNCMNRRQGVVTGGKRVEYIRFVDNMGVLAEMKNKLITMLRNMDRSCEEFGIRINKKKTKCMILGGKGEKISIRIGNEVLERVEQFKYSGTSIIRRG